MNIPNDIKNIIEPFTGNGDLINFIEKEQEKNNVKYILECYDYYLINIMLKRN